LFSNVPGSLNVRPKAIRSRIPTLSGADITIIAFSAKVSLIPYDRFVSDSDGFLSELLFDAMDGLDKGSSAVSKFV